MPHEITVPRLGWSMDEGTFVGWLKRDGEMVRMGDLLFEIESDKATQPIESLDEGVLRIPPGAPQPGAVVAVGAVLGYLVEEAAAATFAFPTNESTAAAAAEAEAVQVARAIPAAAPSVRRLARQLGVPLAQVGTPQGATRLTADDVRAAAMPSATSTVASTQRTIASPRARRVAGELGIDWKRLAGTGRNGRIRERDVRQANAVDRPQAPAQVRANETSTISPRRRTIAARMLASRQETAGVTLTSRADATNLVALRSQFQAAGQGLVPTYTDILAKLAAAALGQHPLLAARWENDAIVMPAALDLGIAVDTEAGLLVPVLRDVNRRTLLEVAAESRDLIARARAGRLSAEEMQGGVFTITNLGAYGIDAFTPLIHLPQAAILGLGAIRSEPAAHAGQVVVRDVITLSLTFDHRVVDGAPAARFVQTLVTAIENPAAWLLA